MNFKGSYMVCEHGVEKSVTFDHGFEGSIAEDTFFVIKASNKGYSFDWVDGEMLEQSPFTFMDIVRQRRRWHQGAYYVVISKNLKRDLSGRFYQLQLVNTFFATLGTSAYFFSLFFPYSYHPVDLYFDCFLESCQWYFYWYGTIYNFNLYKYSLLTKSLMFITAPIVIRYMLFYNVLSFIWALASSKSGFQIVKKSQEND